MQKIYPLLFFLLCSISLSASAFRGFLLTKDGYQLTGYFNLMEYGLQGNFITFTNDFGDVYAIHPMLVSGFGFSTDGRSIRYVSRYHEGQWFFLREDVNGRSLRLFTLPDGNDRWVDDSVLRLFAQPPPTYWLETSDRQLLPLSRLGYKKSLRDFLALASPEIAGKIGSRGYRYRDIYTIVAEVNALGGRKRRRL